MMKRPVRFAWLSVLGLVLAIPLGGCQGDNEGDLFKGQKGTADPKYKDDDASYQQYYKDSQKKAAPAKGKASTPAPAPEPATKPAQ
jgi:hypothetical protein